MNLEFAGIYGLLGSVPSKCNHCKTKMLGEVGGTSADWLQAVNGVARCLAPRVRARPLMAMPTMLWHVLSIAHAQ
jgi:hypothetical protein